MDTEFIHISTSLRLQLGYGIGHVLNDVCASLWFTYFLVFFHLVLEFSASQSGNLMLIGQVMDALSTPFVGYHSDHTDNPFSIKYGKRKLWHLFGTACVLASFPFIFTECIGCSSTHKWAQMYYYAAFIVIFQIGWAAVQISHLSLIPELSEDDHTRTHLTAIRYGFTVFSNLFVYIITWIILHLTGECDKHQVGPTDAWKFRHVVYIVLGLGTLTSIIFHLSVTEKNNYQRQELLLAEGESGAHYEFLQKPVMYQVAGVYMCTRLVVNISQVLIPLYLHRTLGLAARALAVVPLALYLGSLAAAGVQRLAPRSFTRKLNYLTGAACAIAGFVWIYLGSDDDYKVYFIYVVYMNEKFTNFNTVTPQMALWPMGAVKSSQNVTSQLRYASLPREIVCTENLTPWKKLLPCESSRGFSALLNSRMIHNTNYHSIGVHVRKICKSSDCLETQMEFKQTVALVYDYDIINSNDWSFRKLFGQGLPGACPLSSDSKIYVDITLNDTQTFTLTPSPENVIMSQRGGSETKLAVYNVKPDGQMINIGAKYKSKLHLPLSVPPPLHFTRYILGYGKEYGGIVTEITNNCWTSINVVVLENAPWWLPIQLSSLRINGEAESNLVMSQFYSPGRSRQKPYHLELLIKLPPKSTTTITIDFEFVFLKWQEYPPDANHGFYVGSALISANLPTARNYTSLPITGSTFDSFVNASKIWYPIVFRTNGAMVSLPTPDFSMPYNVICLACTVVALAFGPLHNICTKELVLKPLGTPVSLTQKLLNLFKKKKD